MSLAFLLRTCTQELIINCDGSSIYIYVCVCVTLWQYKHHCHNYDTNVCIYCHKITHTYTHIIHHLYLLQHLLYNFSKVFPNLHNMSVISQVTVTTGDYVLTTVYYTRSILHFHSLSHNLGSNLFIENSRCHGVYFMTSLSLNYAYSLNQQFCTFLIILTPTCLLKIYYSRCHGVYSHTL